MNKKEILKKTNDFVKVQLGNDSSGHDYWHCFRVLKNAVGIAKEESKTQKADMFVIELASLLHDVDDWKFSEDIKEGPKKTISFLNENNVDEKIINHVVEIINSLSFKGAKVKSEMKTIEGKIVQDADRLDAIGAVGVARNFAYGGSKGREMYDPNIKPSLHDDFEKYKSNNSSTINHFYEKSLLLKDLMNTKTAKKIAEKRHKFMEDFLKEFFIEWDGKDLV